MSNDEHEQPVDPAPPPAPATPGPAVAAEPGEPPQPGSGAPRLRGVITSRAAGWVVATALAGAVVALSVTWGGARPGEVALRVPPGAAGIARLGPGQALVGRGLPFRLGVRAPASEFLVPFGLVVTGTVGSVSSSTFTINTPGGRTVTVDEQSSTVYRNAGRPASATVVTRGTRVAVLGSASGSKISATEVAVLPPNGNLIIGLPG